MGQFNFKRICGRPLDVTYLNMTRPDIEGKCPEATRPCQSITSPDNTVCVDDRADLDDQCPIIDVEMTRKERFSDWQSSLDASESSPSSN